MVPTARSPPQLMAIMDTTLVLMDYTQEQIERIAEFASDAANLKPAGPEAWEWGRQAGDAIADTFTDEDWETLLNRLSPDRAARHITFRPARGPPAPPEPCQPRPQSRCGSVPVRHRIAFPSLSYGGDALHSPVRL